MSFGSKEPAARHRKKRMIEIETTEPDPSIKRRRTGSKHPSKATTLT
ncbi:BgTH12-01120 [Blumeria graminis f. sp. triticale]|uniref:BgTH12-01120 n=1 Tax=Blumeria graminis f. sp. triticale TaxID=1689686 RepID=A0A9W4D6A1_BLUGR|nr:BgTH12-01120 [Blumeria graminis f. sp. triticale]